MTIDGEASAGAALTAIEPGPVGDDEALRIPVGIWAQWPPGARWSNEGMVRLLGFLIEGIARDKRYVFRIVLPDGMRRDAEADLATLRARAGRDYTIHSPRDHGEVVPFNEELADFANRHVPVDAWISIFPHFTFAAGLHAPLTVIFPDSIPRVFHYFGEFYWGDEGAHLQMSAGIARVLAASRTAITFSRHVATHQLQAIYGYPASRIVIVPHAPPDLLESFPLATARCRTQESVAYAAQMLRSHATERGWNYLRGFSFEDTPFIAISTADRATKNLRIVIDTLERRLRSNRENIKILMTAEIHFGQSWTPVPNFLESEMLHRDVVSLPDLPRAEHAAFYHCAALTVHPSFFEGGHGPFPFYESVSVGTPCLMAMGPHVAELLEGEPALAEFTFDPYDADALSRRIDEVLADRAAALAKQVAIYERLRHTGWADVARGYAEAALQIRPDRSR